MARVCVRPGCDRVARARLTYDVVSCQVWLDPLTERVGRSQEICDLHTSRLTLPRGWMLCDRRTDEPALFVTPTPSPERDIRDARDARDGREADEPGKEAVAADGSSPSLRAVGSTTTSGAPPVGRPGRRRRARGAASEERTELVLFRHDDEPSSTGEAATSIDDPAPSEGASDAETAGPANTAAGASEPAETVATAETAETAEHPDVADRQDELAALRATSPLLARAFSTSGPQRSVLTQYLDERDER